MNDKEKIKELESYIQQMSEHAVNMVDGKYPICTYRYFIYHILKPAVEYGDGMHLGLLNFNNALIDARNRKYALDKLKSLVDGALEIITIWPAETPAQKEWKTKWIEEAQKLGASYE